MILGWCMIAGLTLYPTPDAAAANNAISMWCLVCGELGVVDVTLNCLLFVPLGLGIGIRGVSRWRALILIVATTLTVELLQLKLIIGRDASLSDVLTTQPGACSAISWPAGGGGTAAAPSDRPRVRDRRIGRLAGHSECDGLGLQPINAAE